MPADTKDKLHILILYILILHINLLYYFIVTAAKIIIGIGNRDYMAADDHNLYLVLIFVLEPGPLHFFH